MRAYSLDLRTHVLRAVDAGVSKAEAARVFGISVRTIDRYLQRRRETGEVAAIPSPGQRPHIAPAQYDELTAQLQAHPDATLAAHCQYWQQAHKVALSVATMSRTIARLGWTFKKSPWSPPNAMRRSAPTGATRSPTSTRVTSSSSTSPVQRSR